MGYDPHSHLLGISAFVNAVEAGSFSAASGRLGLSKSAVGKNVARLEERLGVRLLQRTTRRLSLTPEGQMYYASCQKVLDELGSVEAQLASRRQEVSGVLRLNLPFSLGRLWIMPVLVRLAARHPKLELEVSFADRLVDLAEEGIDLVVRLGELGNYASLRGRSLGRQKSVLCASPGYLAARGRPRTIADLAGHDCLIFMRDGRSLPWRARDADGRTVEFEVRPRHVVCHGEALRDAALAGMGIVHLTTWLAAEELRAGRLEPVLGEEPLEGPPISVLWHDARMLTPKLRVAIDTLVEAFTPAPPWERL